MALNRKLRLTEPALVRHEHEVRVEGLAPVRRLLGLDRRTVRPDHLNRGPGQSSSRETGQDMQRGPPRPDPSSEPLIATTSMPASSRRALVSTFRS